MSNLQLIKQENFGEIQCDIWQGENQEIFMSIGQLADALEYASKSAIENMLFRNKYLNNPEFSVTHKLCAPDGKSYDTRVFTEDGVYEIIMLSKSSVAREFRTWFRKVLKTLRKHGLYALDELLDNPEMASKAFAALHEERQQRIAAEQKNQSLEAKIEETQPLVTMAESIMSTDGLITIGDLAKILRQNDICIGRDRLFMYMRDNGYLMKSGTSYNMPTQKAMEKGLFRISEKKFYNKYQSKYDISRSTQVTPKGQLYFINLFLNDETWMRKAV